MISKKGQSRFAALDALRNRIWNVTKQADLRPLTGMRQGDGSWLLSAQTESQAEQESKKVKKLAKRGDIDFEAFYKEFLETDVEDWDKLPDRWNTSKKVIDELIDQAYEIEDEKLRKQQADEKKATERAFYKERSEAEDRASQVITGFNKQEKQLILICFNNAFKEDRTLSLKTFRWRLDDYKLDRYTDSLVKTLTEAGVLVQRE